jgi:flagellar motor switch protein FliN
MSEFDPSGVEAILNALQENAAAIAESLGQCFDLSVTVELADSGVWSPKDLASVWDGPGVATIFRVGGQAAACLLPASMPLPDWFRQPNDSQSSRMNTLAMEWGMNLFPADLEATETAGFGVTNLSQFVERCSPVDWAATAQLQVTLTDRGTTAPLLLVWPLAEPVFVAGPSAIPAGSTSASAGSSSAATAPDTGSTPMGTGSGQAAISAAGGAAIGSGAGSARSVDPLARLRKLPVTVSVRLAEKRIPVSQLLGLSVGTLISFNKSCEGLLDLYVNNAVYAQGEAVKIGEKFGLKLNQIGVRADTANRVLND